MLASGFDSPIASAMFGFRVGEGLLLMLVLLISTPTFVMIGAIGAALSVGAKKGKVMLSLLVMPLYVPVLIFGVNTSYIFINGSEGGYVNNLLILFGGLLFFIPISAVASAKAIDAS